MTIETPGFPQFTEFEGGLYVLAMKDGNIACRSRLDLTASVWFCVRDRPLSEVA